MISQLKGNTGPTLPGEAWVCHKCWSRVLHILGKAIPLSRSHTHHAQEVSKVMVNMRETLEIPIAQAPCLGTYTHGWLVKAMPQKTPFIVANAVVDPWDENEISVNASAVGQPLPYLIKCE